MRWLAVALLGGATWGCAHPAPTPAQGCAPVTAGGTLPADASALAGRYALTLVATRGPQAGDTARGSLTLQANPAERRSLGPGYGTASAPLYGFADLPLETVGALELGGLTSTDPAQPGVLVIDQRADRHTITLRLGAEANRRDQQRFDGGFTVLQVLDAGEGGFRGLWRSGVAGNEAEGFFCARPGTS